MAWNWYAFAAPLALNAIEGGEAALLLAASAARAGWRRALTAGAAGLATLALAGVVLYAVYAALPGSLLDYGVAAVIFALGAHEVYEGLAARGTPPHERPPGSAWPAYLGVVTEGGEALVYTFAVGSSFGWRPAAVGGTLGFFLPWLALTALRRVATRVPAWKQELGIGIVLMAAATSLAVLRATGTLS